MTFWSTSQRSSSASDKTWDQTSLISRSHGTKVFYRKSRRKTNKVGFKICCFRLESKMVQWCVNIPFNNWKRSIPFCYLALEIMKTWFKIKNILGCHYNVFAASLIFLNSLPKPINIWATLGPKNSVQSGELFGPSILVAANARASPSQCQASSHVQGGQQGKDFAHATDGIHHSGVQPRVPQNRGVRKRVSWVGFGLEMVGKIHNRNT